MVSFENDKASSDFEHWERLLFRDYLIEHPDVAREYSELKAKLSKLHRNNRVAYTDAKTKFIKTVTENAKRYYKKAQNSAVDTQGCATFDCHGE